MRLSESIINWLLIIKACTGAEEPMAWITSVGIDAGGKHNELHSVALTR